MRKTFGIFCLTLALAMLAAGQVKPRQRPTPTPTKTPDRTAAPSDPDKGTLKGRTYSNKKYGFQLVFPDTWLVPDDDYEAFMKTRGFDLSLKAPDTVGPTSHAKLNRDLKNIKMLVTAYRSLPFTPKNSFMQVSIEDLSLNPQIDDAVDYFDAMRSTFKLMKLPADFEYSETGAEKLGAMQFGYIDTSSKNEKKRMYATVRNGHAIMFTLTYTSDEDLATMRRVLEEGKFDFK